MVCYLHNIKLDKLKYNLVSILDKYNEKIKRYSAKEIIFKEIRKIDEDIINLGETILKNDFEIRESISDCKLALIMLGLLPCLKEEYTRKNIDEDIFYNTISDLIFRLGKNYEKNGKFGISRYEFSWLSRIFRMRIFKFNSLQFEKYKIDFNAIAHLIQVDIETYKKYNNRDVLFIHVMEHVDISKKSCDLSFNLADAFFGERFREYYCCSWLLFDGMEKCLNNKLNILNFKKRFKILANSSNICGAIEKVFNTNNLDDLKNFAPKTSLQRNILKSKNSMGLGIGIIKR